ncbi:MAG: hypothetical protein HQL01_07730 [Nitrospirae bacterium]|nr:hypothetical protein [Nitrospirota bacterium]
MKRILPLALFFLFLMATGASAELFLSNYEAQFEAVPNASGQYTNVLATLRITYVADQPLSNGFKFTGSGKISKVTVTSTDGRPIKFRVEALKEHKISYDFPPVTSGNKTILITFLMEDAIKNRLLYGTFDAGWVGRWQIPVNKSVYTFVFPPGFAYSKAETNFVSFNETMVNGKPAIQIVQSPLSDATFSLKVKPSFGERSSVFFIVVLIVSVLLILYIITNIKNLPDSARRDSRELTPGEVGYLKKGLKHSICVTIFDLLQLGRLMKTPPNKLQSLQPDNKLYAYELVVMDFFKNPGMLKDLFNNKGLIKDYESEMLNSLQRKGCLKDVKADMAAASRVFYTSIFASIVVIAAGIYSDVGKGYILLSLIAPAAGLVAGSILYKIHPKSGRAKYALEKWEKKVDHDSLIREGNPMLSYAVAILGLSILAGTVFDEYLGYVSYARAYHEGSSGGCSGCSSGISSGGSDGGGSDGGSGGCGGCGGGGD